ncbi:MAG: site-2 protease family protein [Planctomycetia bacterium]|nr:site-2 protease family protein [Planctomycetia bacterium]
MKWSWKIGEVRGIAVYVHATFFILLAFAFLSDWSERQGLVSALEGVGFVLAIFGCIVLHELGHALTAARFGIRTRDITLLPIGGVARMERIPENPRQELWVALAGPAVNMVIAAVVFVGLQLTRSYIPMEQLPPNEVPFWQRLLVVNVFLGLFNLLPAFPMDGGRVLRALLATRLDYARATQIAASVGQSLALLFALVGLLANPILLFVALFVWIGAPQEAGEVRMKSSLNGISVAKAMLTDFQSLAPQDSIHRAIQLILAGSQHDFPVIDNARVVGVLTRSDLLRSLARAGSEGTIETAMQRTFSTADADEPLTVAIERFQTRDCPTMPVLRKAALVGLLTLENVGELVMIREALENALQTARA